MTGPLPRRRFLGYVLAAPVLATADFSPAFSATPTLDLNDIMTVAALPTSGLISVEVNPDGTVSFALPRAEVGQGITTVRHGAGHRLPRRVQVGQRRARRARRPARDRQPADPRRRRGTARHQGRLRGGRRPGRQPARPGGADDGGVMDGIALALTSSLHLRGGYFLEASWDN